MILGLDGLRAIAFLLIFGFHTKYIQFGWVGVQLFFVLSGFLITSILVRMRNAHSPRDYFIKFYSRRFLRIFPLYYFYLLLMWGVSLWLFSIGYRPILMKLFQFQLPYALGYVYNFHYASAGYVQNSFLLHFWSLSVEEQFYILWPLLVFIVPENRRKWFLGLVIMLGPLFRIAILIAYRYSLVPFLDPAMPVGLYPLTFNHLDAFGFGGFIALYRIPRASLQLALLTVLLPALAILWRFFAEGEIGTLGSMGYDFLMPVGYQYLWGYTVLNYYSAVLVYAVSQDGLFTKILEFGILKYIGKISYGLYVYHYGVIWFMLRMRDLGMREEFVKPLSAIAGFLITFILASLTYRFIEIPFLQLKDKFFPVGH